MRRNNLSFREQNPMNEPRIDTPIRARASPEMAEVELIFDIRGSFDDYSEFIHINITKKTMISESTCSI